MTGQWKTHIIQSYTDKFKLLNNSKDHGWVVCTTASYPQGPGFDSQPDSGNLEVFHGFIQVLWGK
jgi:hypothetical protein